MSDAGQSERRPGHRASQRLQDLRRGALAVGRRISGRSRRDRRPARRQRRRQVDAGQDDHGLSPPRSRRGDLLPRQAYRRLVGRRAPAASASRPSIRSARSARSSRSGATCSWGASRAPNGACSTSSACAQESARLMSEHMGFTSAAVHPDNVVDHHVGRREAGRGHHPRAAISTPSSSFSTSRPWACRSPRRRRRWSSSATSRRPANRRSSSTTTSSTSIRWSTASTCSTAGKVAGCLRQDEISMDELIDAALPRGAHRLAGVGHEHERSCHRQARTTTASRRRRSSAATARRWASSASASPCGWASSSPRPRVFTRRRHLQGLRPDDAAVRHASRWR